MEYERTRSNQYDREQYYRSEDMEYRRYHEERLFARGDSLPQEHTSTSKTMDKEPFSDHRREEKKSEV